MKKVFLDTEFTRVGMNTSLISVGMVSEENELFYVELEDYDKAQITGWLQENIMNLLTGDAVSSAVAARRIEEWLENIRGGRQIQLVSAGKLFDILLVSNLWAAVEEGSTLKTWRNRVPACIDHRWHLDLDTAFALNGLDPNMDRVEFSGMKADGARHNALFDAMVVKACWERLFTEESKKGLTL